LTRSAASLYSRFNFKEVGRINYCSLTKTALSAKQLSALQRRLVVATFLGGLSELESTAQADLHRLVTPGGVSLMQVAAVRRQLDVGEWLLAQGARLDLLSAWDLGWGDRMPELARRDPRILNQKSSGLTPLHQAVLRRDTMVDDDLSLIEALLAVGTDPTIEDDDHNATPIGWATAFSDAEAERLLTKWS
jgi:hypothetical protein